MKGELRFSKPHLSFLSKSTTTRGAQITSILWKSRKRQSYAFDSYLADRHIILTVKNHSVVVCGCVRIHMPIFVWFDLVLYLMKFFSRRGLHLQPYKIPSPAVLILENSCEAKLVCQNETLFIPDSLLHTVLDGGFYHSPLTAHPSLFPS